MAITRNYEIGNNLKRMQVRHKNLSRPMISRGRNAMSTHLLTTIMATTPKSKMVTMLLKIGVLRHILTHEEIYAGGMYKRTSHFFMDLDSRALII